MWKARRICELSKGGGRRWETGIAETFCQSSLRARFSIRLPPPVISTAFEGTSWGFPHSTHSPIIFAPWVFLRRRRSLVLALRHSSSNWLNWSRRNLLPSYRVASIANINPSVLPFADRYLRLGRCMMSPSTLDLQQAIAVAHYPVVGDSALLLQTEYFIQFRFARSPAVEVFLAGCLNGKSPVVLRQVLLIQKLVYLFVRADRLSPQLLDQTVLMGAMISLHPSFGLSRQLRLIRTA